LNDLWFNEEDYVSGKLLIRNGDLKIKI